MYTTLITGRNVSCNDLCCTGADNDYSSLGNDDDFDGSLERRNYLEARDFMKDYEHRTSNCPLYWNSTNAPYLVTSPHNTIPPADADALDVVEFLDTALILAAKANGLCS